MSEDEFKQALTEAGLRADAIYTNKDGVRLKVNFAASYIGHEGVMIYCYTVDGLAYAKATVPEIKDMLRRGAVWEVKQA